MQRPIPFIAPEVFDDADAALQRVQAIYAQSLNHLREAMRRYVAGEPMVDKVRVCSLGQITNALFEVGGQYRRNM